MYSPHLSITFSSPPPLARGGWGEPSRGQEGYQGLEVGSPLRATLRLAELAFSAAVLRMTTSSNSRTMYFKFSASGFSFTLICCLGIETQRPGFCLNVEPVRRSRCSSVMYPPHLSTGLTSPPPLAQGGWGEPSSGRKGYQGLEVGSPLRATVLPAELAFSAAVLRMATSGNSSMT